MTKPAKAAPGEFTEDQLDKLAGHESAGRPLAEVLKEDFFTNGRKLCLRLREAWLKRDTESLKQCAHALRSPALTLGLKGLAALCEELENAQGAIPAAQIDKLDEMYGRACAWLARQGRSSKAS